MSDPKKEVERSVSLRDTRMKMSQELQVLVPEEMLDYYERTNEMHCGPGEGGSKFEDASNIFEVIAQVPDLAQRVNDREDDREALLAAGAPESAFLPATKGSDHPEGLPEALYFKVEGVEGRLGIVQLSELPKDTRILVRREKGESDPDEKGYNPVSFTAIQGAESDMPKTDYATVIVGRANDEEAVWTTHPGAPIRPASGEFDWSKDLVSPEKTGEGQKQEVMVVTVKELLKKTDMSLEDYIKIVPGDMDEALEKYDVV